MKDFSDVTIGSVGEFPITLKDLLFEIKTDLNQNLFEKVVHNVILGQIAQELGVSVSDPELQAAADKFRAEKGLISAEETNECYGKMPLQSKISSRSSSTNFSKRRS